jgi:hypothetical protein
LGQSLTLSGVKKTLLLSNRQTTTLVTKMAVCRRLRIFDCEKGMVDSEQVLMCNEQREEVSDITIDI